MTQFDSVSSFASLNALLQDIGTSVSIGKQKEIQEICLSLCKWERTPGFPGTQCVPLDRYALHKIVLRKKYFASEKSDGVRHMLLLLNSGVFLIDSTFRVRSVPMRFPNKTTGHVHHRTLLDGEMVYDRVEESKFVLRFLVFDVIALNGSLVMDCKLTDRLKMIQNDLIWPRKNDTFSRSAPYDYSKEPFSVRLKDYYELKHLDWALNEVVPKLPHPSEGLIFTPIDMAYTPGFTRTLFKWKPLSHNSADFILTSEFKNRKQWHKLMVMDSGTRTIKDFAYITFSDDEVNKIVECKAEGKVIECVWDANARTLIPNTNAPAPTGQYQTTSDDSIEQTGGWKYLRVREDKKLPNDDKQVQAVIRSINDNITKEEIINVLCKMKSDQPLTPISRTGSNTNLNSSGSFDLKRVSRSNSQTNINNNESKPESPVSSPSQPPVPSPMKASALEPKSDSNNNQNATNANTTSTGLSSSSMLSSILNSDSKLPSLSSSYDPLQSKFFANFGTNNSKEFLNNTETDTSKRLDRKSVV